MSRTQQVLAGDSHYFEFVAATDENIKVCRKLCAGNKLLSSFKNMTVAAQHS